MAYADADGDGYAACEECDDGDAAVNPGATEACNGVDDDCDGTADEGATGATWYADNDGDGYGDASSPVDSCTRPSGYVAGATDCDDGQSAVNPGAAETCNGVDDDCDGTVDGGASDATTWYADADGDGYGDSTSTATACDAPSGYVAAGGDCDDADAAYNPGATEACDDPTDYNCDGSVAYADADGDGWAACEECDDTDAGVNPSATESCNGVDDDCDGTVDGDDAVDAATWYTDADGDGYGDAGSSSVACDRPAGSLADDSDCDDTAAGVNPGAVETCNGVDDDCDGTVDDGASDGTTWYADADGDGYGDSTSTTTACDAPAGYVAGGSDCDDTDAAYNPGATEACDDPADYNCDGSVAYADADGDGYAACEECDDGDAAVNPGATEACNGVDDDCDGTVDEDSAIDATTWYADADGDGYGDATTYTLACDPPTGYVETDDDCDDADATVNPGATETCNNVDDDCNGLVDDGTVCTTCDVEYYGDDNVPYLFCWSSRLSWTRSETACQGYGYELVTLDDDDENTWVADTAYAYAASRWWIGLNDRDTEGTYAWSSGDGVSYTNWAAGEPNDPGGNADCVAIGRNDVDTWSDETCPAARPYVCEGG